ncbi:MAG: NUDIX domain-containing protein [Flavobacteriaceae bacterium]|nr:NUDIX domain-containing protein [Flavobacteriaceae bacterium]
MEDEFIDILNDDLSFLKTCLKSEAHKHGYLHASVHVWFYTVNGEILLQKRSPNKIAFPNLWDVSVAGHISTGETAIASAVREIKEEIGLNILLKDLEYIGLHRELHQHTNDFIDNEVHYIYLSKLSTNINQLTIQEEELSAIKLINIHTFSEALKEPNHESIYVPHHPTYYSFIFDEILKRISKS